jgi:hypothetical protein
MWYLGVYAAFAIWVLVDSSRRRIGPLAWTLGTLVLGPIVLPVYFAKRPLRSGETREGGTAWNILRSFALLWTVAMAAAGVSAMVSVSAHTATLQSDAEKAGAAIGTALGLGLIGALWFFPMLGALVLGLILKKSSVLEKGPTGPLSVEGAGPGPIGGAAWVGIAALSVVVLWSLAKLGPETASSPETGRGIVREAASGGASTSTPQLALLSTRGYETEGGGYYVVEGQVQNVSTKSLDSIEAVSTWYAADGTLITSDSALIEYNPILPGQTSPFKTMSTANPKMSKYAVEFKAMFGSTIQTEDRRKAKGKAPI